MPIENYNFTDSTQDLILACMIGKPDEFLGVLIAIKPEYFNGKVAVDTAAVLYEMRLDGESPSFLELACCCRDRYLRENPDHAQALYDYVAKLQELDTSEWQQVRDRCRAFARERALQMVIKKLIVTS